MILKPFSYSNDPDNMTTFSMTPGNSAPALAVWLFMLTTNNFLPALQKAHATDITKIVFKDGTDYTIDLNGISQIVNLTPEAIIDLFNMYLLPDAPDTVRIKVQKAFGIVAEQFQAFATNHSVNWGEDECPGITGLKQLAASGAIVDPWSYQKPSKKAIRDAIAFVESLNGSGRE